MSFLVVVAFCLLGSTLQAQVTPTTPQTPIEDPVDEQVNPPIDETQPMEDTEEIQQDINDQTQPPIEEEINTPIDEEQERMSTDMQPRSVPQAENVTSLISGSKQHSKFSQALQDAGLSESLNSEGSYTVFAPTDTAFSSVPTDQLSSWMMPENRSQLSSVLTYHIIPGNYDAATLASKLEENNGTFEVETLQGSMITFKQGDDDTIYIEYGDGQKSSITSVDYLSGNGVVHFVDHVIVPPVEKVDDPDDKN